MPPSRESRPAPGTGNENPRCYPATATCAGAISDSDPQGGRVTVRFTDTNRAEVPVGACDLSWRNPSGTTTRLRVDIEPGRVTWVRGSLLELPQGAGESYAVSDAAGLVNGAV